MMSRAKNELKVQSPGYVDPNQWVEIIDPQSKNVIYANPATGECSWDPPKIGYVKERSPEGEWWELFDRRHNLPYYYNTVTRKTVWVRPKAGLIIPLAKIQTTALSNRTSTQPPPKLDDLPSSPSPTKERYNSQNGLEKIKENESAQEKGSTEKGLPQSRSTSNGTLEFHSSSPSLKSIHSLSPNSKAKKSPSLRIQTDKHTDLRPESMFSPTSQNEVSDSKVQSPTIIRPSSFSPVSKSSTAVDNAKKRGIGLPTIDIEAAKSMSPMNSKTGSRPVTPASCPKSLPKDLQSDINQFQIDGFAKKFFTTHKKGLFRKKVPLEKLLTWSMDSMSQPLMSINKNLNKDALKGFKSIQRIMGDRPKGKSGTDGVEIQWLIERCLVEGELRDEFYVQLCKQLTENPGPQSNKIGWELIAVFSLCFPPSKNFENYLVSFVNQFTSNPNSDISTLASYCQHKLKKICLVGPKGKVLSIPEIEQARQAAFHPSVFGESLDTIMLNQRESFPDLKVPKILSFLTEAVLQLNGVTSEGIFRVPGDMEMVAELKLRLDQGKYDLVGITDCNVPASLLKLWLRDLEDPLIPTEIYDQCLISSKDPKQALAMIDRLPEINQKVAKFMLSFLKEFIPQSIIQSTKMSTQNLAMVFAPSFLRCPSEDLTEVFANSKLEQEFIKILIVDSELTLQQA